MWIEGNFRAWPTSEGLARRHLGPVRFSLPGPTTHKTRSAGTIPRLMHGAESAFPEGLENSLIPSNTEDNNNNNNKNRH